MKTLAPSITLQALLVSIFLSGASLAADVAYVHDGEPRPIFLGPISFQNTTLGAAIAILKNEVAKVDFEHKTINVVITPRIGTDELKRRFTFQAKTTVQKRFSMPYAGPPGLVTESTHMRS